jgi:hypothetical protein
LPPGPGLESAPVADGGKDGGFGPDTSGRVGVATETGPVFPLDFPVGVGSMTPPGPIRLSVLSGLLMPGEFVGAVAGPLAVWATAVTETNIAAAMKNVAVFMTSSRTWVVDFQAAGRLLVPLVLRSIEHCLVPFVANSKIVEIILAIRGARARSCI